MKIKTKFLGVNFSSPLILPSGVFTTLNDFLNGQKNGAGGITTKSYTRFPRQGNPQPVVARFDHGFINSVGLRNVGIEKAIENIKVFQEKLSIPVIISIFDTNINNFIFMIEKILSLRPKFIELNLSCPNVDDEFGKPLGMGVGSSYLVVKKVKEIIGEKTKIIAKLSPNVLNIKEIAKAVEEGGADAIAAINTLGPGMLLDVNTFKPKIGAKMGGVSGPAIFPVALRCVYEIYQTVKIPIIGMGGVSSWEDAVAMFLAGASLVGVGSAIYLKGWDIFTKINHGIDNYLKEKNFSSINEMVGLAHKIN